MRPSLSLDLADGRTGEEETLIPLGWLRCTFAARTKEREREGRMPLFKTFSLLVVFLPLCRYGRRFMRPRSSPSPFAS